MSCAKTVSHKDLNEVNILHQAQIPTYRTITNLFTELIGLFDQRVKQSIYWVDNDQNGIRPLNNDKK